MSTIDGRCVNCHTSPFVLVSVHKTYSGFYATRCRLAYFKLYGHLYLAMSLVWALRGLAGMILADITAGYFLRKLCLAHCTRYVVLIYTVSSRKICGKCVV